MTTASGSEGEFAYKRAVLVVAPPARVELGRAFELVKGRLCDDVGLRGNERLVPDLVLHDAVVAGVFRGPQVSDFGNPDRVVVPLAGKLDVGGLHRKDATHRTAILHLDRV